MQKYTRNNYHRETFNEQLDEWSDNPWDIQWLREQCWQLDEMSEGVDFRYKYYSDDVNYLVYLKRKYPTIRNYYRPIDVRMVDMESIYSKAKRRDIRIDRLLGTIEDNRNLIGDYVKNFVYCDLTTLGIN